MQARRVREVRQQMGLSQERFAQFLGVSAQTVRRWESGLTRPLPIISARLAAIAREAEQRLATAEGGTAVSRHAGGHRDVVDINLGLGLGGVFKGIGSLLELASRMAEAGEGQTTRTGEVEGMGGKLRGVYGVTVRLGLEGKPVIEQFGNIRETEAGPVVAEEREPIVDLLDEGDHFLVIAELPGIDEKDISLEVKGAVLEIGASTKTRSFHKTVDLPTAVDSESLKSSYRNGVLEVRLTKQR